MNRVHEWANTGLILVIAIMVLVGGNQSAPDGRVGGYTDYDAIRAQASKIGSSGSLNGNTIIGTCALTGMNVSQTASTTSPYDCAVTGVVAGDYVVAQFATSSTAVNQSFNGNNGTGWVVQSAIASSTDGYITVRVANLSGGSVVPAAVTQLGSTTRYMIIHPLTTVPGL